MNTEDIRKAAEAALADGKNMPATMLRNPATVLELVRGYRAWVPVSERLPEVGAEFLATGEGGSIDHFRRLDADEYWNMNSGNRQSEGFIRWWTHWMPLPEPPK